MPSNERTDAVIAALAESAGDFTETLRETAEDIRRYLLEQHSNMSGNTERLAAQLGPFGTTHIDAKQFATLFNHSPTLARSALETVEQALAAIYELNAHGESMFTVAVPPDGNLLETVRHALARVGRAFGAAHVVHAVRSERYNLNEHARSLGSFPFVRWNRAERQIAPPLVVEVQGQDVRAAGLAEFLDGQLKIVLVVDGACTPVPLVRLITPSTYVVQTTDPSKLTALASFDGPGIGALVPDGCAEFVHDPTAGSAVSDRITVVAVPEAKHRKTVAGLSSDQQNEELQLLRSLAAAPKAAPEPVAVRESAPSDPADKLAAWLLSQADMSGVE